MSFLTTKPSSSMRPGLSGSTRAILRLPFWRPTGRHWYMRAVLAGTAAMTSGPNSPSWMVTTSVCRWLASACRMASASRMPKSCKIWNTDLPLRLNSPLTSSNWRSSMRPCSLISVRSGLEMSSGILCFAFDQGGGVNADGLGEFEFLEFGLDGDGVLRFGDDFLAGDHPGEVFLDEERIEGHHAVFG